MVRRNTYLRLVPFLFCFSDYQSSLLIINIYQEFSRREIRGNVRRMRMRALCTVDFGAYYHVRLTSCFLSAKQRSRVAPVVRFWSFILVQLAAACVRDVCFCV